MRHEGWMILTRRLCAMFAGLAIANEVIWRTQSTDALVTLDSCAFPACWCCSCGLQIVAREPILIEEAAGPTSSARSGSAPGKLPAQSSSSRPSGPARYAAEGITTAGQGEGMKRRPHCHSFGPDHPAPRPRSRCG
jgi:hypothetical protein